MRHFTRHVSRGFTLIELSLVVLIASVVGTTFFSVMYMQNLSYLQRLDEVDSHQNARAALNVMRRYLRSARWGLAQDPNASGFYPVGVCYNTSNILTYQSNCDNVSNDGGSDRLRVVYINNDTEFVGDTLYGSGANCSTLSVADTTKVHVNVNPVTPFVANTLGAIGGTCSGTAASDLVLIGADSGSGDNCLHRYTTTAFGGGAAGCGAGNYDPGFSFGRATVADFYMYPDASGVKQLMLRTDPRTALNSGLVVAFDVEDFQVSYGIDTSNPTDRAVDKWCTDPRTTAGGGTGACDTHDQTGTITYTTGQNYSRIVAVQIILRIRTDTTRPNIFPLPINTNLTTGNPVANAADGYKRWIYSTTVALRNNNLP